MSIRINRIKEVLKPKYYKGFEEWMRGQTYDDNGIYDDDFLRWIKEQEIID